MSNLLDKIKIGSEYGFRLGKEEFGVEVVKEFTVGTYPHAIPYVRLQIVSSDHRHIVGGYFIECPLDDFKATAWQFDCEGVRRTFIPDAAPSNGMSIDVEVDE